MDLKVKPKSFQKKFFLSNARFPAFIAAWGTGKTMFAILKGVDLSKRYPNNLGLIVRKNFTDLRDSTIKDFTRYTGIKVPTNKDVVLPNGSRIMFRHMDELSGIIQNVNLGWFYIEQAEEFDSDEEFEKLDGRLRRVLTPSEDVQRQLISLGVLDKVCDFNDLTSKQRLIAENKMICEMGLSLRQGMAIANTNGHNWIWRRWKNKGGEAYIVGEKFVVTDVDGKKYDYGDYATLSEATSFDNAENLPADTLASWRKKEKTSPALYRRCVMNSWEDVDTTDNIIPYEWLMRAVKKELISYDQPKRVVSCDPAEFGDDHTVIYAFENGKIIAQDITCKKEPMDTAGRILRMVRDTNAQLAVIDADGIGSGVRSRLVELGVNVLGIKAGEKAENEEDYRNMKAQMWFNAQQMFRDDLVSLPDDEKLIEDLAAHTYGFNSKNQMNIEKKRDVKKKLGGRSPDQGDAFVLGLWALTKVEPMGEVEDVSETALAESYTVESVI